MRSRRRAWSLVEAIKQAFTQPLVATATGGSGGASLTDFGRDVLERYRAMERKAAAAIDDEFADFRKRLAPLSVWRGLPAVANQSGALLL